MFRLNPVFFFINHVFCHQQNFKSRIRDAFLTDWTWNCELKRTSGFPKETGISGIPTFPLHIHQERREVLREQSAGWVCFISAVFIWKPQRQTLHFYLLSSRVWRANHQPDRWDFMEPNQQNQVSFSPEPSVGFWPLCVWAETAEWDQQRVSENRASVGCRRPQRICRTFQAACTIRAHIWKYSDNQSGSLHRNCTDSLNCFGFPTWKDPFSQQNPKLRFCHKSETRRGNKISFL